MEEKGTVIMNKLADNHSDNMAYSRFFNNESVTASSIIQAVQQKVLEVSKGQHVLCIQDTTEINYQKYSNFYHLDDEDLGPVGNNNDLGFFLHSMLVVDTAGSFPLGLSDVHIWNRHKDKQDKYSRNYKQQSIEEKESYRWISSGQRSIKLLGDTVAHMTIIGDRESDIYEEFLALKGKHSDVLVRSKENRLLYDQDKKLYEYLSLQPIAGTYKIKIRTDKRKNRESREALIEVRYCRVKVARPKNHINKTLSEFIELTAVEAKESALTVPEKESPIHWRLLTTHQVNDGHGAVQIIGWYKARWLIEEHFRLLKQKGINIESSQLERGKALKKLAIMALEASLRILQLRQDRDGLCSMEASIAFTPEEITFAEALYNLKYKGKTRKQQNLHKKGSLARMSYIIARIGGWKGYRSTTLPGPITFIRGLEEFDTMYAGHTLLGWNRDVYKE